MIGMAAKAAFHFSYVLHFEPFTAARLRKSEQWQKVPNVMSQRIKFYTEFGNNIPGTMLSAYRQSCYVRQSLLRECVERFVLACMQSRVARVCFCFTHTPVANRARISEMSVSRKLLHARLC